MQPLLAPSPARLVSDIDRPTSLFPEMEVTVRGGVRRPLVRCQGERKGVRLTTGLLRRPNVTNKAAGGLRTGPDGALTPKVGRLWPHRAAGNIVVRPASDVRLHESEIGALRLLDASLTTESRGWSQQGSLRRG